MEKTCSQSSCGVLAWPIFFQWQYSLINNRNITATTVSPLFLYQLGNIHTFSRLKTVQQKHFWGSQQPVIAVIHSNYLARNNKWLNIYGCCWIMNCDKIILPNEIAVKLNVDVTLICSLFMRQIMWSVCCYRNGVLVFSRSAGFL